MFNWNKSKEETSKRESAIDEHCLKLATFVAKGTDREIMGAILVVLAGDLRYASFVDKLLKAVEAREEGSDNV